MIGVPTVPTVPTLAAPEPEAVMRPVPRVEYTLLQINHHCCNCGLELQRGTMAARAVVEFIVGSALTGRGIAWCSGCAENTLQFRPGRTRDQVPLGESGDGEFSLTVAPQAKTTEQKIEQRPRARARIEEAIEELNMAAAVSALEKLASSFIIDSSDPSILTLRIGRDGQRIYSIGSRVSGAREEVADLGQSLRAAIEQYAKELRR